MVVVLDAEGICPRTAGGTARTIARDLIVAAFVGAERIRGAYGDGRRFVARRMNLTIDFLAQSITAVVTRSGNYDYARIYQPADSPADRIVLIGINRRRAEARVHDADVVGRAICEHPIERRQDA